MKRSKLVAELMKKRNITKTEANALIDAGKKAPAPKVEAAPVKKVESASKAAAPKSAPKVATPKVEPPKDQDDDYVDAGAFTPEMYEFQAAAFNKGAAEKLQALREHRRLEVEAARVQPHASLLTATLPNPMEMAVRYDAQRNRILDAPNLVEADTKAARAYRNANPRDVDSLLTVKTPARAMPAPPQEDLVTAVSPGPSTFDMTGDVVKENGRPMKTAKQRLIEAGASPDDLVGATDEEEEALVKKYGLK